MFNVPINTHMRELIKTNLMIEEFAVKMQTLITGFDSKKFIDDVHNARLTTTMTLEEAFEHEKSKYLKRGKLDAIIL